MPNLPSWLQRTPAEETEEARTQEQRRAGHTRARLTEAERLISRGALLEETARGNLAAGDEAAKTQLAEALAMQGRYAEAAEHHPNDEMKQDYLNIQAAVEMNDEEKCNCPDTETDELIITPRFNARNVFSTKHGTTVALVTCSKCGHVNARPPRSRLLNQQAAMNQNLAAVKGSQRGVRDDQLLKK